MEQKEPTVNQTTPAGGNQRFYWGKITDNQNAGRRPNKHSYKITLPQHTQKTKKPPQNKQKKKKKKKKKKRNKKKRKRNKHISTQFLREGSDS